MAAADSVEFVADENGWELHVVSDDGDRHVFNVHGLAVELAAHADATIGAYKREHDFHRAEFDRAARYSNDPTEVEASGYDPSDPKHPDWHASMSGIWDNRRED